MSGRNHINERTGLPERKESKTLEVVVREPFDFVQAADIFAAKGITEETAAFLGMTHSQYTAWAMTQAGHDAIQQAHMRLSSKLDARLSEMMDKVSVKLEDRLENGDMIYNRKTGEFEAVPVNARDLAIILGALFDRRQLLRKQPTKITEPESKLSELTDKLRRIGADGQPHQGTTANKPKPLAQKR